MNFDDRTPAFVAAIAILAMSAACSSSDNVKGAGYKGKDATDQKVGTTAKGAQSKALDKGTGALDGVNCTQTNEGMGWCNSDLEIFWCAGGHFYSLDCKTVDGKVCAYTDSSKTVDCAKE